MRKQVLIAFLLIVVAVFTSTATAQNTFIYEKGKSFKDVPAFRMDFPIRFKGGREHVVYENKVPGKQTTLLYTVELPSYKQGLFFSRDSRPGDYEWPNNTNRLLPWKFNRLEELTASGYPGIPSNARPSVLGDALLLLLEDGTYLFAKAVSGTNSISWFQINIDGTLSLYLSTLGEDTLSNRAPILLYGRASSAYQALQKAYTSLIADKEISTLRRRSEKTCFEAFDYLGWCTWEHYHYDIDESKILNDLEVIETSGIPVRYVLIDDGHIANSNRQLTSFTPDRQRFPHGWKKIMARKQNEHIRWMGLWYSLSGYWMGISSENDFPEDVRNALYSFNGTLLPGKSTDNIQTFYQYYIQTLKNHGFDFLKIDNQAFTLPLYMGGKEVITQAKACNLALEEQTHRLKMGLMNCMAQNILNTDHTRYSAVTRASIDYKKYDENMAKSHLFQSYTNTLLLGQSVWPDHDMFHSSDSICGALMARSKALSGGPVYLSDSPNEFVKENILPLIDEKGKLFCPVAPAIPAPESILANPLQDGNAYRVFAPTGEEAVSLICYNLNTRPEYKKVTATIGPDDYLLRETMTGKAVPRKAEHVLLFDWQNQSGEVLSTGKQIELDGFTDRLFHLCPIRKGWAVIGIQEKYLSPATVEILSITTDRLELNILCPGTLKIWVETPSKKELRSIPVRMPGKLTVNK